MYRRVTNITNVGGRANYIRNKENREEVVGFFDTASDGFWKLLARENQEQFRRNSNSKRADAKASEARELVVGLPSYAADEATAQFLAQQFKNKLGVECMVAIHKKYTRNDKGEKVLNVHAHIIHADRRRLEEPIRIEEKRAGRTYYYDEHGKQCAKAKAVKVTRKGSITQEACVRNFSDKLNFFDFRNYDPFLEPFAKQFSFQKFDITKQFPQKKIGQHNPKERFIREYNELVKEMNVFFNVLDSEGSARPAKETFCEKFSVPARFSVRQTEDVRKKFRAFQREKEVSEEELRFELRKYEAAEKELAQDIQKTETVLKTPEPMDFVAAKVANAYRSDLEEKYHRPINNRFLAYLKEKYREVKTAIIALRAKLGNKFEPEERGADERRPTKDEWTK